MNEGWGAFIAGSHSPDHLEITPAADTNSSTYTNTNANTNADTQVHLIAGSREVAPEKQKCKKRKKCHWWGPKRPE